MPLWTFFFFFHFLWHHSNISFSANTKSNRATPSILYCTDMSLINGTQGAFSTCKRRSLHMHMNAALAYSLQSWLSPFYITHCASCSGRFKSWVKSPERSPDLTSLRSASVSASVHLCPSLSGSVLVWKHHLIHGRSLLRLDPRKKRRAVGSRRRAVPRTPPEGGVEVRGRCSVHLRAALLGERWLCFKRAGHVFNRSFQSLKMRCLSL